MNSRITAIIRSNHERLKSIKLPFSYRHLHYVKTMLSRLSDGLRHISYDLSWFLLPCYKTVINRQKESEEWSSQLLFQFKQLERRSLKKKKIRASTGLEPMTSANTGAMLYQLSYEATHWERGQSIEFISSREEWNDVKFIWNNSYMNCGCRWEWRMIIALNFPI